MVTGTPHCSTVQPCGVRACRSQLHGRHIFDVYEHFTTSSIAVAREWTGGVPVSAAFLDTLTADPDFKLDDLCEPFYDASRMNELGTGLSPAQIIGEAADLELVVSALRRRKDAAQCHAWHAPSMASGSAFCCGMLRVGAVSTPTGAHV